MVTPAPSCASLPDRYVPTVQIIPVSKVRKTFAGSALLCLLLLVWLLAGSEMAWGQAAFLFSDSLVVNSGTADRTVTVPIQLDGTIAEVRVLSSGIAGTDFVAVTTDTCSVGHGYPAGQSCALTVRFQPKAPGERRGAVVLLDDQKHVLGMRSLYGIGLGPLSIFIPATMNTVAGDGTWVYRGDDVAATETSLFLPGGVAVDGAGNIFIADSSNNRIRRVDASTRFITTVAGNGSPGSGGDGGLAIHASVSNPGAIILDGAGNLYIADSGNHAIRKLTLASGVMTTIAGQLGMQSTPTTLGDGGPATSATLNTPQGLAFDAVGNLYIADTGNNTIRCVDASTGIITRVAGTGTAGFSGDGGQATLAALNTPWGLATDVDGNLYIADLNNQRIRKLSGGFISTVIGTGDQAFNGDGQLAGITTVKNPAAVAVDVAGNLYIADAGNNLIRKISATSKLVSTVAGSGNQSFGGDLKDATKAGIYGPYALALDSKGNLYFSDLFHHRIREVENSIVNLSYVPIRVGRTSAAQNQTVENDGNAALSWSGFNPDQNSAYDPASTTCSLSTPLDKNATCILGAQFSPQTIGASVQAVLEMASDASNSPAVINMSGEVDALEPTQTSLSTSANPAALGSLITLTAVVSGNGDTTPNGTIRFFDGTGMLGTATTNSAGKAVFTISTLALGSHSLTAAFTGDVSNSPSTSAVLVQVIKQAPAIVLVSGANPANTTTPVTFTATVTASQIQPTGNVAFSDGASVFGNGAVNGSGIATFTTSALSAGTHAITATYQGDTNTLAVTSNTVTQTINKWSTATMLSSNASSADVGTSVVFTVQVVPTSSSALTGDILLKDGSNLLITLHPDAQGSASYSTTSLVVGSHSITASYAGDSNNDVSTSAVLTETIHKIATTTVLSSSANPANGGATIRLTATVTPSSTNAIAGALSGTATFQEGSTVLGTVTLSTGGVATLDISTLSVGTHAITVTYSGNDGYAVSTSNTLPQKVQLADTTVQLSSSANPSIAGSGVSFTAVVAGTGGIPTGTVSFLDGAVTLGTAPIGASGQATFSLSTLSAGSHPITAKYEGDAKDSGSTSMILTQVVQQATTAIVLTSSSNPAIAGTSITFVATLTSSGGLPTGQIVLREGGTTLGTAAISATGSAQFTLSSLQEGSHNLIASFAGDTSHAAGQSVVLIQVVNLGTSSVLLGSSPNPSVFNSAVTFTAKVTGSGTQPTGSVTFLDGATVLSTVAMDSTGVAIFNLATLTIGNHTITARYAGDNTHAAASPVSLVQQVVQATNTTLVSNINPSIVGSPVRFTATVTGVSSTAVSGTVRFTDGATLLGSSTLGSNGVAVLDISTLVAGTHLIVATYGGDSGSQESSSAALQQIVNVAGTTVSLRSNVNPSVAGTPVTFMAEVVSVGRTATGTVTFLDGSNTLGTATVANGVASLTTSSLAAGQHAVLARYNGDSDTQSSISGVLVQIAQARTSSALASSLNPALTAQSITLTATVANGSNATGILTFLDGSSVLATVPLAANGTATLPLSALPAGTHALSVSYSGDSYNLPSVSSVVSETVQLRPTTTTGTPSSNSYLSGQQITLVAVVHSDNVVAQAGTVEFRSGNTVLGTGTVSSGGVATLVFFPTAKSYSITAVYSGDAVYAGSTADAFNLTEGETTTFSMVVNPSSVSLASGSHTTISLTFSAANNFTDTLALGCLELPEEATCTFSTTKVALAANGSQIVQLTLDTGTPLGAGPKASVERDHASQIVEAGMMLPLALGMGFLLFRRRRGHRLTALLSLLMLLAVGFGMSGCGNTLDVTTTPAGNYTVRIMASGANTGASQVGDLSVTVK